MPPVAAKIVSFICCLLSFVSVPEGGGVVCDPLGVGARGAAKRIVHVAGGKVLRLPEVLGVPGHQGRDKRLGETVRDHALPGGLWRDLLVAQRPADLLADDGDHLLVGKGLRPGQLARPPA